MIKGYVCKQRIRFRTYRNAALLASRVIEKGLCRMKMHTNPYSQVVKRKQKNTRYHYLSLESNQVIFEKAVAITKLRAYNMYNAVYVDT